ncbi:hypothetical protein JHK84_047455 [Glycine max]|nr:hypothetical protein JHK86_047434 [Glycine max]KAG4943377.1 hypothetical protein JHK85_048023 [Glycine max]KAG5102486.1 hypothetical protein JHK84_047455 [Glycine max]
MVLKEHALRFVDCGGVGSTVSSVSGGVCLGESVVEFSYGLKRARSQVRGLWWCWKYCKLWLQPGVISLLVLLLKGILQRYILKSVTKIVTGFGRKTQQR